MINTHSHLFDTQFDADRDAVVLRAKAAGVRRILMPNIDVSTIEALHRTEAAYPDYCFSMMGLHPTSVSENYKEELSCIERMFGTHAYCAIGEIGIDLYWDQSRLSQQLDAFETQIKWSKQLDLPVMIHSRNAFEPVYESVARHSDARLKGVFHSFGGTVEQAKQIMELPNFYLGINGVVTYKNAGLRDVLPFVPLSRLVIETDDPYLAPVPYRGKRNEPAYLSYVSSALSEIYHVTVVEVNEITSVNAIHLFGD
ncbi:MAG: TatD family hydrolase [Bacteroidales bacterium]|nr:TatD family hydrolase [Bacteroidales bacterium]MDD4823476.1 TatD family hydrolase [Bacteroidales bacterium]